MFDQILNYDKELLIFLNNLGSEPFDGFWMFITKQKNWVPFFIGLLYLLKRTVSWKNLGVILVTIALLITFTDQFTNVFKFHFIRSRPCSNLELIRSLRFLHCSTTYSFFSGHASNSMATMLFLFLLLRKHYKYVFLLFLFPLIFAYSRIYLALHFPLDILVGYTVGAIAGFSFYKLYVFLNKKYFKFEPLGEENRVKDEI